MSTRIRLTVGVGIIIIVTVIALIWLTVLSPRLSEAARLDQQALDLESANLGLLNSYNRSLQLAREATDAAQDAQILFAAMPQQADIPRVLEEISEAAIDSGLNPDKVQTINTGIPVALTASTESAPAGIALAQMPVTISAQGTLDQTLTFLGNLQRLDRVLLVTSSRLAEVAELDGQNQRTIQISGTMFVLQSELPNLVAVVQDLIDSAAIPAISDTTQQK